MTNTTNSNQNSWEKLGLIAPRRRTCCSKLHRGDVQFFSRVFPNIEVGTNKGLRNRHALTLVREGPNHLSDVELVAAEVADLSGELDQQPGPGTKAHVEPTAGRVVALVRLGVGLQKQVHSAPVARAAVVKFPVGIDAVVLRGVRWAVVLRGVR